MTDKPRPPPPSTSTRFESAARPFEPDADALLARERVEPSPITSPFPSPFVAPGITMLETRLSTDTSYTPEARVRRPEDAARILQELVGHADREHFVAVYLNGRHFITHAHIVSRGTLGSALVHPREVFKGAILANAAAVIIGHNHPTGGTEPSVEDEEVEKRLTEAGKLLGIRVIDALIVGPGPQYHSTSNGTRQILELKGTEHDDDLVP